VIIGWKIDEQGEVKRLHSGGDPGFGSMYIRIPHQELSVLMLSNLDNSWQQFAEIRKQLFLG
jgi:hypothetical protein